MIMWRRCRQDASGTKPKMPAGSRRYEVSGETLVYLKKRRKGKRIEEFVCRAYTAYKTPPNEFEGATIYLFHLLESATGEKIKYFC